MMRKTVVGLAMLVPLVTGCETMQVKPAGRVEVESRSENASVRAEVRFGDEERETIADYYEGRNQERYRDKGRGKGRGKDKGLPPGLAKREQLPPGLAKRETLPPGLDGDPLPQDLEEQLEPLPEGYARVRVGFDIAIINENTRLVVDVVKDIALD